MKLLFPSIQSLENRWSKPSDTLLWQLSQNESSVAPALRNTVLNDPDYQQLIKEPGNPPPPEPVAIDTRIQLPAWMLERVETQQTLRQQLSATTAGVGVMIAVDELDQPDGVLERDVPAPLTVLLRRTDGPGYWQGWYVAAEADYASVWDYVLQDGDGHFDPAITAMVQVWNPLRFRLPARYRVIGQLEASCLAAIEALAAEFADTAETGCTFVDPEARPGLVGMRQTRGNHTVVTGTPLGQPQHDPRCRYQTLYRQVAALLDEPVKATVPVNQAPWWQNWLDSVERFAAELNWTCSPPPTVWVMGAETSLATRFERVIDNRLSIRLLASDTLKQLHFRLLTPARLELMAEVDNELEWRVALSDTHAEATWTIPLPVLEQGAVLILRDEQTGSAQQLILPGKALP